MIEVKNLSYTYSDGTKALHDISVSFPRENIFAVTGMSGSGKTTLLNCLARFLRPQHGSILLDGVDIADMDEDAFRSGIGVVFQRLNLFPHLTVLENMSLAPIRLGKGSRKQVAREALEILARLNIRELADNHPSQISGGQAQRAAIARGLILRPKVMLLDEPTSALDAKTSQEFSGWLRELKLDTSFIIVTHDLPFAETTASKGIFMRKGHIVKSGPIKEVLSHIDGELV
ncbi:MAG: amino acid ABC transporter ATP-binding protein [Victivallaceae bacterium]|nr:ATP-binding cassette domain-containing protein [Victivallaceae bacterium]